MSDTLFVFTPEFIARQRKILNPYRDDDPRIAKFLAALDRIEQLTARLALAEQVCYALIGQQEHGTAKHRMALDAALDAWKREAAKGGME